MPKMKTKKCAVKRMKLSATGKVMRSQGGKAHLNNGKSRSRKRNLRGITTTDKTVQKTYARALQGGR
ncbi:MAG: 50S ribosomal protein L35 [Kiritimatiellae bacterium]|nr:50S ribosomal protein L35 [Kiritimatiellia bacterium]